MIKCAICKHAEREWSWQPFGPDESPLSFTLPGSHYRGFAIVPVCGFCKRERIEAGETVRFMHKHTEYRYSPGMMSPAATALWDGGTTGDCDGITVTMLCQDTPAGHDIVGLIYDGRLATEIVEAYNKAQR